jgi:CRISPR system Cascade subunit CasC
VSDKVRFIQIHWLASYPATLLNRDEAGLAKRIPFGGDTRSRISSQCLKRHWRLAGQSSTEAAQHHPWALAHVGIPMGSRSREVVERSILPMATQGLAPSEEMLNSVRSELLKGLYGEKAEDIKKRQALFFGDPEIRYLAGKAKEALKLDSSRAAAAHIVRFFKDERANLKELKHGAGLESALFGRMVTSDPASNRDAAIHVAHALSVHTMERELDYMTVVDDLKSEAIDAESGSAGIFDMELASGVYYGYVVVDVTLLIANLAADGEAASKVVEHLVHLIADVSPGAKKGSTAPYSYAEFMLVEAGSRQPRTLANAFRKALPLRGEDIANRAVTALDKHLTRLDAAYGSAESRRQLSVLDTEVDGVEKLSLGELAKFAAQRALGNAA